MWKVNQFSLFKKLYVQVSGGSTAVNFEVLESFNFMLILLLTFRNNLFTAEFLICHSMKLTGVTDNINNRSLLFKRPSKS